MRCTDMGTKCGGLDWNLRGHLNGVRDVQSTLDNEKNGAEKNVDMKFQNYINNLESKDRWIEEINYKRQLIERIIREEIGVGDVHIFGSYARGTLIESSDGIDIDLMFILDGTRYYDWLHQQDGPSNCLNYIRQKLINRPEFYDADISVDRNSVSVRYGKLKIDIVPAFQSEKGYSIPDTAEGQKWISTNPRLFNKILGLMNSKTNGRLNDLIKIVKGWNNSNGKLLRSFHIENMVYLYFKNNQSSNINSSLKDEVLNLFSRLPVYIQNSINEPVYNDVIDSYLDTNRSDAINRAQKAKEKLSVAENYERNGQYNKALEIYSKVFGKKFEN